MGTTRHGRIEEQKNEEVNQAPSQQREWCFVKLDRSSSVYALWMQEQWLLLPTGSLAAWHFLIWGGPVARLEEIDLMAWL